jgi:hypothetical protein
MVSVAELKQADFRDILTSIVAGGLGLYLAIALADAIRSTVTAILNTDIDSPADNWIAFGIALIIVAVAILIILMIYRRK